MWICPKRCDVQEVIANVKVFREDYNEELGEVGVQIDVWTGDSLNKFMDGTVGVPDDIKELAEEYENPVCPDCYSETYWIPLKYMVCDIVNTLKDTAEEKGRIVLIQDSYEIAERMLREVYPFPKFSEVVEEDKSSLKEWIMMGIHVELEILINPREE